MKRGSPFQASSVEDQWRGVLEERLARAGISDWKAQDLALGVAAWVMREVGSSPLRDERMDALLVHALCAVGRVGDAARVGSVPSVRGDETMAVPALRLLARDGVIQVRCPDARTRVWRLDVDKLASGSARHELWVCRLLFGALIAMAEGWRRQADSGADALSVSGLYRLARRMEGPRASLIRVRRRVQWMFAYIRAVLTRLSLAPQSFSSLDLVA